MDTLLFGATLPVVGLFEGHGRGFDVFNSDGYRMARHLYLTRINGDVLLRLVELLPQMLLRLHRELARKLALLFG